MGDKERKGTDSKTKKEKEGDLFTLTDVEGFVDKLDEDDFQSAIYAYVNKISEELEARYDKRVTKNYIGLMKQMLDKIHVISGRMFKRTIVAETKLNCMMESNKSYELLADKITRLDSVSEEKQQDLDNILIVKSREEDLQVDDIKKEVKEIMIDSGLPLPTDIITTKDDRIINKLKNNSVMNKLKDALEQKDDTKERMSVSVSRRGKERLLLLNVNKETERESIEEAIRNVDAQGNFNFEIFKSFDTKSGNLNWIIDTDTKTATDLLDIKNIAINFQRIRITRYVRISRCFKCQVFGHISKF